MGVILNFQNVLDECSKIKSLSLPIFKKNIANIEFVESHGLEIVYDGSKPTLPFAASEVFLVRISDWRRLTANNAACKAVYEVTFNITDSKFDFKPGDTIGIVPVNSSLDVDTIISHLGLIEVADLTYILSLDKAQKSKLPAHLPIRCKLRHILTYFLNIRSVPKKLFLLALSQYTKDENERRILEYLCSKEGSAAYTTHILNENLCILDIFTLFKSCVPPVEVILLNLPRLLPRPYSVVNSKRKDSNVLKICFSVINVSFNRKGLTTGWLEDIILNATTSLENRLNNLSITDSYRKEIDYEIPIYLRKNVSGFGLPEDWNTPLLMVGPGTGVAPYVGFLEEKRIHKKEHPEIHFGEAWLIFGCRNPELDNIYEEELNSFLLDDTLDNLVTAVSRVDNDGIKYVQDAIIRNGKEVVKLIEKGATIFVCGDHNTMATQVKENLKICLMQHRDMSSEEADKYICDMQRCKKYLVDVWS